jgi:uncharacterized membrane protein YqjE
VATKDMMARDENIASGDWPSLLTRVFHDLARIVQTELRLFQAGLEPILSNMVDRFLASMAALMAFAAGGICLLAALVLFLTRWLGWPGSLAAAGVICLIAGLASLRFAKRGAPQITPLGRSFEDVMTSAEPRSS